MDPKTTIGYITADIFYCVKCAFAHQIFKSKVAPVYVENIKPYSQTCHVCGDLIVDGWKSTDGSPLSLFERRRDETQ